MALIIEDGTIVIYANSWVDLQTYIDYADSQGVTITDTEKAERNLIQAQQYITSFESKLKGYKVSRIQYTAYPREYLYLDGFYEPDDEVPQLVKQCQLEFALLLYQGKDLFNAEPQRVTRREKVEGAVEVEYFGSEKALPAKKENPATMLLNRLMKNTSLSFQIIRR